MELKNWELKDRNMKAWLKRSPVVAILRGVKPDEVEAIVEALAESGIEIVEVPLNSPQPFDSIARISKRFGADMLVGAGTVMDTDAAQRVADAGGRLIVTPHADVTVTARAKSLGLFAVPGFFTPTEAFALLAAGADALKLFPAEAVSPAVLSAMRAVFPPDAAVLAVGGVSAANIAAWRKAGAAATALAEASTSRATQRPTFGRKPRRWSPRSTRIRGEHRRYNAGVARARGRDRYFRKYRPAGLCRQLSA
jgi:2-dehydro-3-deoxyphosphogalactonate aldolase